MNDYYFRRIIYQLEQQEYENDRILIHEQEMKKREMDDALAELENMSAAEAYRIYNTDSKADAREGIIEYWSYLA